jgi:hypothetical protein
MSASYSRKKALRNPGVRGDNQQFLLFDDVREPLAAGYRIHSM